MKRKEQPVLDAKVAAAIARNVGSTSEQLDSAIGASDTVDRLLAKHPNASAALLEKLSHSSDKTTRRKVVLNANAAKDVLVRLAPQFPGDFFKNPAFDWLLLEDPNLLTAIGQGVLKNILKRPDCPVSFMKWAAEHGSEQEQLAVAMNPEAPAEILKRLAEKGGRTGDAARAHTRMAAPGEEVDLDAVFRAEVARLIAASERDERAFLSTAQVPAMNDVARIDCLSNFDPVASILLVEGLGGRLLDTLPGRKLVAILETAPGDVLRRLAADPDLDVRWNVLANHRADDVLHKEILESMATNEDAEVRAEVAWNPLCSAELLGRLADDRAENVRIAVAAHLNCPGATRSVIVSALAASGGAEALGIVVRRGRPSEALLETLSQDTNEDVREAVAERADCPQRVLSKLAKDLQVGVRRAVAANENCPGVVLDQLADDTARDRWGRSVQDQVVLNQRCPGETLERLARASETAWKEIAANPNCNEATFELLVGAKQKAVRETLAKNLGCPPGFLEAVARDSEDEVRHAVAMRSSLPAPLFGVLARDEEKLVRQQIAANPECPPSLLLELAQDKDNNIRYEAVRNASFPADLGKTILEDLALIWRGFRLVELLRRPEIAPDVLATLSRSAKLDVRKAVASGQHCPAACLEHLSKDRSVDVRRAVASRPDCPVACIERMAKDKSVSVRRAVAGNPSCPPKALAALAEDASMLSAVARNPACPPDLMAAIADRLLETDYGDTLELVAEALCGKAGRHKGPDEGKGRDGGDSDAPPTRCLPAALIERVREECVSLLTSPRESYGWRLAQAKVKDEVLRRACAAGDILYIDDRKAEKACNNRALVARLLGLCHRNAPLQALARRSKSVEWVERMAVARNPFAPPNVIEALKKDSHRLVALQAAATTKLKDETARRQEAALAQPAGSIDLTPLVSGIGTRIRTTTLHRTRGRVIRSRWRKGLMRSRWRNCLSASQWTEFGCFWPAVGALPPDLRSKLLARVGSARIYSVAAAVWKDAPADVLTVLAKRRDARIRTSVAGNLGAPPPVLAALARDPEQAVRRAAAANPAAAADVLVRLVGDAEGSVRSAVAGNPHLPSELLLALAQDSDEMVRLAVAGNHAVPELVLSSLADDQSALVRMQVARSTRSTVVLDKLAKDLELSVVQAVAGNPCARVERMAATLLRTVEDAGGDLLMGAALNPRLPDELIDRVIGTLGRDLRKLAGSVSASPMLLERLGGIDDADVRQAIAGNPSAPAALLGRLARDGSLTIRRVVASNPATPADWLTALSRDADKHVREEIAKHQATPRSDLERLAADNEASVRAAVARNDAAPADLRISIVQDLLQKEGETGRALAASHPLAPAAMLETLAQDPNPNIQQRVFSNPNCRPEQLVRWAQDSLVPPVLRLSCTCNPNYPLERKDADAEALVATLIRLEREPAAFPADAPSPDEFVVAFKVLDVYPDDKDPKAIARAAKSKDWLRRAAATFVPGIQPSLLRMLIDDEVEIVKQLAMQRLRQVEQSGKPQRRTREGS